jgi:NADH dehydrogenase [ubiquinone] 1 alpha subcomplex assembly factor 1
MEGADPPSRTPKTLFTFHSPTDIQQFVTGCDADIGGNSSVHLDLDPSPGSSERTNAETPTARFWGIMNLGVKPGLEGKIRTGYAGFRNKVLAFLTFRVSPLGDCGWE